MTYLIIFGLAFLLGLIFFFTYKHRLRLIAIGAEVSSGFILSFFAGVRDLTVGTDVSFYMEPSFRYVSLYSTFRDYWSHYHFEFLYAFLCYYIERYTHNVAVFFFVLMAITAIFIFLFINDNFNDINVPIALLLFLFGFFNLALNYSRQMVAVAILLFSYRYIKKEKYISFLVCLILAFLFHRTALLGLLLPILYEFDKIRLKNRILLNTVFIGSFLMLLALYNKLLTFLIGHESVKYLV